MPAKAITLEIGQGVGVEHRHHHPTGILPINTFDYDSQSMECYSLTPDRQLCSKGAIKGCLVAFIIY